MTYNGWTNYETWLTNLHFENFDFSDEVEDGRFDDMDEADVKDWLAEAIESYVDDHIDFSMPKDTFLCDAIRTFTQEVDWQDIADHYVEDIMDAVKEREETTND